MPFFGCNPVSIHAEQLGKTRKNAEKKGRKKNEKVTDVLVFVFHTKKSVFMISVIINTLTLEKTNRKRTENEQYIFLFLILILIHILLMFRKIK